jgi:hypothetical protein
MPTRSDRHALEVTMMADFRETSLVRLAGWGS